MRFETEIFLTKRSPQTLSNLCLSARTESALHITCILTVYTACIVSDSTSDETYTNVLLYWLTRRRPGPPILWPRPRLLIPRYPSVYSNRGSSPAPCSSTRVQCQGLRYFTLTQPLNHRLGQDDPGDSMQPYGSSIGVRYSRTQRVRAGIVLYIAPLGSARQPQRVAASRGPRTA